MKVLCNSCCEPKSTCHSCDNCQAKRAKCDRDMVNGCSTCRELGLVCRRSARLTRVRKDDSAALATAVQPSNKRKRITAKPTLKAAAPRAKAPITAAARFVAPAARAPVPVSPPPRTSTASPMAMAHMGMLPAAMTLPSWLPAPAELEDPWQLAAAAAGRRMTAAPAPAPTPVSLDAPMVDVPAGLQPSPPSAVSQADWDTVLELLAAEATGATPRTSLPPPSQPAADALVAYDALFDAAAVAL